MTITNIVSKLLFILEMARIVKRKIAEQGEVNLASLKGILFGLPGVGKTVTIKRLTGEFRNITLDGHMESTGIQKPSAIPLYHDSKLESILIKDFWSAQTVGGQLGTLLHCMTSSESSKERKGTTGAHRATFTVEEVGGQASKRQVVPQQLSVISPLPKRRSSQADLDSRYALIQQFLQQAKWKEAQAMLEGMKETTLLYVIDTGGQPEFFEILPLLLQGPCLGLVFISLAHSLQEPLRVSYRNAPDSYLPVQYDSTYTQLEMIHMLLAAFHSLNSDVQFQSETFQQRRRSAAFLIGTYFDEVDSTKVKAVIRQIEKSIKSTQFFKEDLLAKRYISAIDEKAFLFPLDNLNGDEREIHSLRLLLTNVIKDIFRPEPLPTTWAIFHLLLRHKYEKLGLCSLQTSVELGGACGLNTEKDVRVALQYIHTRFGTILHYHEVTALDSFVVCDPNLIFRPITKLVAESFGANPLKPEGAEVIRQTGEISYNDFNAICSDNDTSQLIPTEGIVELLKHYNIISEIHNGDIRLFMSCLLRPYEDEDCTDVLSINPAPLLFTFHPSGYLPVGLFHILTSRLLNSQEFDLDENRFKNRIGFIYGNAKVEILSNVYYLEARIVSVSAPERYIMLRELLETEITSILACTPHMMQTKMNLSFYCPDSMKTTGSIHIAICKNSSVVNPKKESPKILSCSKCSTMAKIIQLHDKHKVWFQVSVHAC